MCQLDAYACLLMYFSIIKSNANVQEWDKLSIAELALENKTKMRVERAMIYIAVVNVKFCFVLS